MQRELGLLVGLGRDSPGEGLTLLSERGVRQAMCLAADELVAEFVLESPDVALEGLEERARAAPVSLDVGWLRVSATAARRFHTRVPVSPGAAPMAVSIG